ncbi:MAG: hypothetical protein LBH25_07130 [Fibromonadaceae bacterium]|jgi:uncharacterized protein (TIGR02145 family)|nr:hypothetical protein [Fibromonadaceae bacterium]
MIRKFFTLAAAFGFLFSCAEIPDELRDEADGHTFNYCVLSEQRMCLTGSFIHSDCSGKPSNNCPYGSPKGCDGSIFNPSTSFCYDGSVYYKCDGMEYNPTTHICYGNVANPAKCGGTQYNPLRHSCCVSAIFIPESQRCQDGVVEAKCSDGSNYYNLATQFCRGNDVHDKCGGKEYNPETRRCQNSVIEAECGSDWYDIADENLRCRNNILEAVSKCGTGNNFYNSETQFCRGNDVYNKCDGQEYPATDYCSAGTLKKYGSVAYGGKNYKTVEIGTQTWMAENLNYNAAGSKCYKNQESICDIYGRLYDWATAMGIDVKYNNELYNSELLEIVIWDENYEKKYQGICPNGWHIPSGSEWNQLWSSTISVTRLKAASGWDNNGNSTDDYGFSALPGGDGYGIGTSGYWWSSSEGNRDNNWDNAYRIAIYDSEQSWYGYSTQKRELLSIRCVMD